MAVRAWGVSQCHGREIGLPENSVGRLVVDTREGVPDQNAMQSGIADEQAFAIKRHGDRLKQRLAETENQRYRPEHNVRLLARSRRSLRHAKSEHDDLPCPRRRPSCQNSSQRQCPAEPAD